MNCENCTEEAVFWVTERWLAEDGVGGVERMEAVCADCVEDIEPEGLEQAYPNYEFKIEAEPEAFGMERVGGS